MQKKYSIILLFILFLQSSIIVSGKSTINFDEIKLDISIDEFNKLYTGLDIKNNSQIQMDENLHGLPGKLTFNFENGRLKWFLFDCYIDELNEKNFNKCLGVTNKTIKEFNGKYGKPYKYEEGEKKFKDPYKEHHWGYMVLDSKWKANDKKIRVAFNFMGGKGDYHLIVSVEIQSADYKYF